MPLMLYEGSLLAVGNSLATSEDCCCDDTAATCSGCIGCTPSSLSTHVSHSLHDQISFPSQCPGPTCIDGVEVFPDWPSECDDMFPCDWHYEVHTESGCRETVAASDCSCIRLRENWSDEFGPVLSEVTSEFSYRLPSVDTSVTASQVASPGPHPCVISGVTADGCTYVGNMSPISMTGYISIQESDPENHSDGLTNEQDVQPCFESAGVLLGDLEVVVQLDMPFAYVTACLIFRDVPAAGPHTPFASVVPLFSLPVFLDAQWNPGGGGYCCNNFTGSESYSDAREDNSASVSGSCNPGEDSGCS